MKMKYLSIITICLALTCAGQICFAQPGGNMPVISVKMQNDLLHAEVLSTIKQNLADADKQYKLMASELAPGQFPRNFVPAKNKFETSNSGWWCSGFYAGTLLNLYEQNHDAALLTEAKKSMDSLAKEQYNTHTHDLGFMMYNSFGNAYRLMPNDTYKQILINSAKSL